MCCDFQEPTPGMSFRTPVETALIKLSKAKPDFEICPGLSVRELHNHLAWAKIRIEELEKAIRAV